MEDFASEATASHSGELDVDKAGIAAPIFEEKRRVIGSISLVGSVQRFQAFNEDYPTTLPTEAAAAMTRRIANDELGKGSSRDGTDTITEERDRPALQVE